MYKRISILGSTGSIGKILFSNIKNKKNIKVELLSCNTNIKLLLKQARELKVKNLIVTDKLSYQKILKIKNIYKYNIYNNFDDLDLIFKKKNSYVMNSIVGFEGLNPTLKIIKHTHNLALANKESIICGWNLILKKVKKYKTKIIPVDSEHFSIWSLTGNEISKRLDDNIEEIFITASGGPFNNLNYKQFKNITVRDAIKHPTWSMGKKISIDSSTLVNKIFEVIEAQRLFSINIKKIKIKVHPKSYIHSILRFKNGLIKILAHEPKMDIPIINSIGLKTDIKTFNKIDFKILNDLNLQDVNLKKFKVLKILNNYRNHCTLFDTAFVSCNDYLISQFLEKKIKFNDISNYLIKILNLREIKKLKKLIPNNFDEINKTNIFVRLKTSQVCIR